jgi:uncharacterized protein
VRALTLTVTERCNLACDYCYARRSNRVMSAAVADAAIDRWLAVAGREPRLSLSFYGGEPLLERELVARAVERLRQGASPSQTVRAFTPTNGVDAEPIEGLELAVSLDAIDGSSTRRLPGGPDSTPVVLASLERLLPHVVLARMTVTPGNVGALAANVRAVARLGFRKIVYLPAYECRWESSEVAAWGRGHAQLALWRRGAHNAGLAVPELPNLIGIERRLREGAPRRACGAGVSLAAVATDGRFFPCYRLVFGDDLCLGDVARGFTERATIAALAALTPDDLEPEDGNCCRCPARHGCTHSCMALGYLQTGNLRGVPGVVCELMRAAVAGVQATFGGQLSERNCRSLLTGPPFG